MVKIRTLPFRLRFRKPFRISHGTREFTDVVLAEVSHKGLSGYGEASLPPYLEESQQSVERFCHSLSKNAESPDLTPSGLRKMIAGLSGNPAARAALNIALYDLESKLEQVPLSTFLGLSFPETTQTSYTLTMNSAEELEEILVQGIPAERIKVKLTGEQDEFFIRKIREHTPMPGWVDVNQGWKDKGYALEMAHFLAESGFLFIEQPFHTRMKRETEWLSSHSPLPLFADESCQDSRDIEEAGSLFSGINIKLMKAGGIDEALKMATLARSRKMGVMLGGMAESSCAASAAVHLSSIADYVDLDGPLLIANDPFEGLHYSKGTITLEKTPGTGVRPRPGLFS